MDDDDRDEVDIGFDEESSDDEEEFEEFDEHAEVIEPFRKCFVSSRPVTLQGLVSSIKVSLLDGGVVMVASAVAALAVTVGGKLATDMVNKRVSITLMLIFK
jgi:hypothetical protein